MVSGVHPALSISSDHNDDWQYDIFLKHAYDIHTAHNVEIDQSSHCAKNRHTHKIHTSQRTHTHTNMHHPHTHGVEVKPGHFRFHILRRIVRAFENPIHLKVSHFFNIMPSYSTAIPTIRQKAVPRQPTPTKTDRQTDRQDRQADRDADRQPTN